MPFLEKMNITCPCISNSRITSWISAAAEQDVRKLKLHSLESEEPYCFIPSSLFTMNKIVTLYLNFCVFFNFTPVSNCFPNLKKLGVCLVIDEDVDSVQNLISSCPVLEELVLHRKGCDGLENFKVSSQKLKRLTILFQVEWEDDDLHILEYVPQITIDCPAVEYFHINDNVTEKLVIRDLSSVVGAKLYLSNVCNPYYEFGTIRSHVFELLTVFSNVTTLSISRSTMPAYYMKAISAADGEIMPTFHILKHLEFFGHENDQWNMVSIIEFLKSTPVLEVLVFEGFTFSSEEFHVTRADVPNCLRSHLKKIEVNGYLGKKDEEKVRYFLENSKVLEKLIFKQKGAAELQKIRRSSSACQVIVS